MFILRGTKDEQGKQIGMWAMIRDVTERKRAESQIKKSLGEKEEIEKVLTDKTE